MRPQYGEGDAVKVPRSVVEGIFSQGRREAPLEACGYLSGGDGVVARAHTMRNADQSPEHFTLDPEEQFRVIREARTENRKIIAVYHTHPASPARPSAEDIRLAFDPYIIYVIASLQEAGDIRAFRITGGEVSPEEMEII